MQRKRLENRERRKWFGSTADFSLRFSLLLRCNALEVPGSLRDPGIDATQEVREAREEEMVWVDC